MFSVFAVAEASKLKSKLVVQLKKDEALGLERGFCTGGKT